MVDISKIRAKLLINYPFWGTLALNLQPKVVDVYITGTIATDGRMLYINEEYWSKLNDDEKMGELAHEVFHCAFGHLWRRKDRDPDLWNIACDIVADYHLIYAGLTIKDSVYYKFCNEVDPTKSAEEVYNQLKKCKKGGEDGDSFEKHKFWDDTDKASEYEWKHNLIRSAFMVKSQGNIPGDIEELINELIHGKISWRDILRDWQHSVVKNEYKFLPPNKKFLWNGTYIPSMSGEKVEIIFAIDTSGSITTDELKSALSEVVSLVSQFDDYTVWYVQCDYNIQEVVKLEPGQYSLDDIKKVKGRGGTRFPLEEIYNDVISKGGEPSGMIYFTDGYGNIDGDNIPIPIIWLVSNNNNFKPDIGLVVNYEEVNNGTN